MYHNYSLGIITYLISYDKLVMVLMELFYPLTMPFIYFKMYLYYEILFIEEWVLDLKWFTSVESVNW